MDKPGWKDDLRSCFDDFQVIAKCRREAAVDFEQFCDEVVEPAFEALGEEFAGYGIKTRVTRLPGVSMEIEISFPGSREDHLHYILRLPGSAVEFRMRLTVRGRKTPGGPLEEKSTPFLPKAAAHEILKLDADALAQDIVARYKTFLYETAVLGS